ncbi:MAG: hypothetical protein NVSMB51_10310 [Solirubrobacteraceae bacterium]
MPEQSLPLGRRLHMLAGLGLAVGALVALLLALTAGGGPALRPGGPVPGTRDVAALFSGIPQRGLTLGDPRAPVTLVELADLQCPFCRAYAQDTLPGLVRDLVRPGRLQLVFRPLPALGSDSLRAARAAGAAAQAGRLWQFAALFYRNQGVENSGYVTSGFLRAIAGAAGAPAGAEDPGIALSRSLVRSYGLKVTPSFLIGRTGQARLQRLNGADEIRPAVRRLGG